MSKHFRDFETYLSQHYGGESFPLDWVMHLAMSAICWITVETVHVQSKGKKPDFFCLKETDYICWFFMSIVQ